MPVEHIVIPELKTIILHPILHPQTPTRTACEVAKLAREASSRSPDEQFGPETPWGRPVANRHRYRASYGPHAGPKCDQTKLYLFFSRLDMGREHVMDFSELLLDVVME